MWPRRQPEAPRRWGLRTVLVLPVVLVALAVAASQSFVELSVQAQTASLVAQRGTSVLEGITQRLSERRQSKAIYAQLLANQSAVLRHAAEGDMIGLAQVLAPQMAQLQLMPNQPAASTGRQYGRILATTVRGAAGTPRGRPGRFVRNGSIRAAESGTATTQ